MKILKLIRMVCCALAVVASSCSQAEEWSDISEYFSIDVSKPVFDRVNRAYKVQLDIKNVSGNDIVGPFRIYVVSENHEILNPSGEDNGLKYFDFIYPFIMNGASKSQFVNLQLMRAPIKLSFDVFKYESSIVSQKVIGIEGGKIEYDKNNTSLLGAKIEVPVDSVNKPKVFSISVGEQSEIDRFLSVPINFGPDEKFDNPVTVSIPLKTPLEEQTYIELQVFDPTQSIYTPTGIGDFFDAGISIVDFQLNHFSSYAADGFLPCANNGNITFLTSSSCVTKAVLTRFENEVGFTSKVLSLTKVKISGTVLKLPWGDYRVLDDDGKVVADYSVDANLGSEWVDRAFTLFVQSSASRVSKITAPVGDIIPSISISRDTFSSFTSNGQYTARYTYDTFSSVAILTITNVLDFDDDIFPNSEDGNDFADAGYLKSDPLLIEGSVGGNTYFILQDDGDSISFESLKNSEVIVEIKTTKPIEFKSNFLSSIQEITGGSNGQYGQTSTFRFSAEEGERYNFSVLVPNELVEEERYYSIKVTYQDSNSVDDIIYKGKRWKRLDKTVGDFSYNDIAQVCSANSGGCSGNLGNMDLTGYKWAVPSDVQDFLKYLAELDEDLPLMGWFLSDYRDPYVPRVTSKIGVLHAAGDNLLQSFGYTRALVNDSVVLSGAQDCLSSQCRDGIGTYTNHNRSSKTTWAGIWLYRNE